MEEIKKVEQKKTDNLEKFAVLMRDVAGLNAEKQEKLSYIIQGYIAGAKRGA